VGDPSIHTGDTLKTQILTNVTFESSHSHPDCGPYPHGHLFAVEAFGEKNLDEPLMAVVSELDHRELGRMMNGGSQSGEGIARWILERLMVTNPEVDGVSVGFGRWKFTVTRERR